MNQLVLVCQPGTVPLPPLLLVLPLDNVDVLGAEFRLAEGTAGVIAGQKQFDLFLDFSLLPLQLTDGRFQIVLAGTKFLTCPSLFLQG